MSKEEEFVESLYDEADEQIKEIYKEQKKNRDKILNVIAGILLTYTILNNVIKLSKKEKINKYNKLSNIIINGAKSSSKVQESVITDILSNTVNNTFNFYSYNAKLKDVSGIVGNNFKGKHFSTRVWNNEKEVAKHLHKQVNDFLNGKINVNQIKKDIETTFNTSAYNAKRLAETEVSRVQNESFLRFCKETDVKKLKYNATLDSKTCNDCAEFDGKIYDFGKELGLPRHPLCRCFYEIADKDYIENNSNSDIMKSVSTSGALNPYSTEAQNHAKQYYESVRHMKTDTKKISENVGWKQSSIDKIKAHVFIKEHDLGNATKERFYPSYDMAQSWQRLIEGKNIKIQDLVLLKHEYLELVLMEKGSSQLEAHNIASKKHNFAKYVK
ncbi:minor capsid protein [Clostridium sp. DL1XJH146]